MLVLFERHMKRIIFKSHYGTKIKTHKILQISASKIRKICRCNGLIEILLKSCVSEEPKSSILFLFRSAI